MSPPRARRAGLVVGLVLLLVAWLASVGPDAPPPVERAAAQATAPQPSGGRPRPGVHPVAPAPDPSFEPATAAAFGEAARTARVRVQVVDSGGAVVARARVQSADCGIAGVTDESGRVVLDAPPGTCNFRAARRDGVLFTRSAWTPYRVPVQGSIDLLLTVDARPAGGLGVTVVAVDGGMEITGVHPGTPAAEAGIEPGEIIVEIDGDSVAELSVEAFLSRVTGPAGTAVEVTLRAGADTGTPPQALTLERAAYDPPAER